MRPWEQQDNEGSAAFGLFRIFLELGPDRSVEDVAEQTGRMIKVVKRLYYKFKWLPRSRQYDNYLARAELDAAKRKLERDAVKWVKRFSELREIEWDLGQQLVAKARKMMAFPLAQERVIETAGPKIRDFETGELVATKNITIIVEPAKFTLKDAQAYADTASKLMRMASGRETERKLLGFDAFDSGDNNLQNARDLYTRLRQEYADRPDVLENLPLWLAENFGYEPKQIEGTVDGEIVDDSLTSSAEQ